MSSEKDQGLDSQEFVLSPLNQSDTQEKPVDTESTGKKAQRILQDIEKAELDSFQEYNYIATKGTTGFSIAELPRSQDLRPDDLIQKDEYPKYSRSSKILRQLEDEFGYPSSWDPNAERSNSDLFCVTRKDGSNLIVQGAGNISRDRVMRVNTTAFKLVFNTETSGSEYIAWLKEDPNQALDAIFKKAIARGPEDQQKTLLPEATLYDQSNKKDPFVWPIKKVLIKDLDTGEADIKELEGTSAFKRAAAAFSERQTKEKIIAEIAEKDKPATPNPSIRPAIYKKNEKQEPDKPRNTSNPSGLNPDAPLTKLINIIMKPFIRK